MEQVEESQGNRRYTPNEKQTALKLADKVGPAEASKKLGIPENTICGWRFRAKKVAEVPVGAVAPTPMKAAEKSAPLATAPSRVWPNCLYKLRSLL
jgi:transposase-like protein